MYDLDKVPFSRFGSYFSLQINDWGPMERALYLCVHCGKTSHALKIDLVRNGEIVDYEVETSPTSLILTHSSGGKVEFIIDDSDAVRIRGNDISLRLEMPAERWTFAYQLPECWAFNFSPYQFQLALDTLQGSVDVDAPWEKSKGFCWDTRYAVATLSPDGSGVFEAAIDEFLTAWSKPDRKPFDLCRDDVAAEYAKWTKGLPEVSDEYTEARDLAAYVNWSACVRPKGAVTRPTMYMSKVGMCNVYNWDNVFNAMAHCTHQPELAWDQLLVMADHQDEHGKSPSSLNRDSTRMTITNSPVHGWGLRYMWDRNPELLTAERMAEGYEYLANWLGWIRNYRTWPGDRLSFHHHGFDGGWDNSSIFDEGVPVITPDYAAYIILTMEVLADLATKLRRDEDAKTWKERRDDMLDALITELWKDDHFTGILRPSGKVVECESLIICMPMVLGSRLPGEIQEALVGRIKDHLHPCGLATEKLDSPNYVEGGYWRGPIWAPSTMLITSGLQEIGETDLAITIMKRFCDMCAEHGFYENFDPVSGKGYYDPAYTWTSSVFMMFANQLHESAK